MKHIALILSTYILSLAFSPVISAVIRLGGCGQSCSKEVLPDKNADGCQKDACVPFSCCLKNLYLLPQTHRQPGALIITAARHDNFGYSNNFTARQSYDIWHPPRII